MSKAIRYTPDIDDRRPCEQCASLRGAVCTAASPGGQVSAVRGYKPALPSLPQRCKSFLQK
jgi:hypothetical protein